MGQPQKPSRFDIVCGRTRNGRVLPLTLRCLRWRFPTFPGRGRPWSRNCCGGRLRSPLARFTCFLMRRPAPGCILAKSYANAPPPPPNWRISPWRAVHRSPEAPSGADALTNFALGHAAVRIAAGRALPYDLMLSKRLIPEHRESLSSLPPGLVPAPGARG